MKNRDIEKNIVCWGSGKTDCGCAGHCPYWTNPQRETTHLDDLLYMRGFKRNKS